MSENLSEKTEQAAQSALDALTARWVESREGRAARRTSEALAAKRENELAYRDAMRRLRNDQRALERARAEVKWWNVFNAERRYAAAVVKSTRAGVKDAKAARDQARKDYPMSLATLAATSHGATSGVTGVAALAATSPYTVAALATAVAAAVTNGVVAWRGRNWELTQDDAPVADHTTDHIDATDYERSILAAFEPDAWQAVAVPRLGEDIVATGATLTPSGVTAVLELRNRVDIDVLRKNTKLLRAVLRLKEDTRLEVRDGRTAGTARITVRTRSKADGLDLTGWKPGDAWAVDMVTGETVPVPLGKRCLFAGASGAGKSWSARPLMAEASEYDDHRLIIFDRKHTEARNWEHRARTVCELGDMRQVCEELTLEGERRLKLIPRGQDVITISPERPRITVFVDEGGELISDSKTKHAQDEEGRKDYDDIMTTLRTIARKYRAAEIILVWCTQKPALSGEGHGLDSQIAGNLMVRLSLALATSTDAQVVFGNDAIEKGWKAHELPMPGFALLRDQELGPKAVANVMRMRAMSPQHVIDLPSRPIWRYEGATKSDVAERVSLEKRPADPWEAVTVPAADLDGTVLSFLSGNPGASLGAVSRVLGKSKSSARRVLDRLTAESLVRQDEQGSWHTA